MKYLLLIPFTLVMWQCGTVLAATLFYRAIRRITRDRRPIWLMGIAYLFTLLAIAGDIAKNLEYGLDTLWQPLVYTGISGFGLVCALIVLQFEIAELRSLERSDKPTLDRRLRTIKAKVGEAGKYARHHPSE
jgi:hypothetical protein